MRCYSIMASNFIFISCFSNLMFVFLPFVGKLRLSVCLVAEKARENEGK